KTRLARRKVSFMGRSISQLTRRGQSSSAYAPKPTMFWLTASSRQWRALIATIASCFVPARHGFALALLPGCCGNAAVKVARVDKYIKICLYSIQDEPLSQRDRKPCPAPAGRPPESCGRDHAAAASQASG